MSDKKPVVLGVTGAIGSGKSQVGKMLADLSIPVIDTDHLAHEILNSPNPAYDKVVARFGQSIVTTPGGPIDRKKLGAYVFAYERARAELEAIMHPAIADLQKARIEALSDHDLVAVLVPLLFEAGSQHKYDYIWCVTINREVQMARLELRDKATREEILRRINAQWPQEQKANLSNLVIDNSFTKEETLAQVEKALALTRVKFAISAKAAPVVTTAPVEDKPVVDTPIVDAPVADAPVADAPRRLMHPLPMHPLLMHPASRKKSAPSATSFITVCSARWPRSDPQKLSKSSAT